MQEPKGKITPLWIIASFVSLTEVVLGYAITKTTGGVQVSITVFVILFAILVATAFFLILWHRPYVFYAPSEYGNIDPKQFIDAVKTSVSPIVREQVKLVKKVEENPQDKDAQYNLIDSLLDPVTRQHLILMEEFDVEIPYTDMFGHKYDLGTKDKHKANGHFMPRDFVEKLEGTGFIDLTTGSGIKIKLTEVGKEFAQWLSVSGQKTGYIVTPFGTWGEPFQFADENKTPTLIEKKP